MSRSHRLWNMYITAAVSVALVLCLVGMECVLLLSAGTLMHRMKENMSLTAVLTEAADSASCARFEAMLSAADYCSDYRYISSEEALQEHIASLGEDPVAFLGYNPLAASYEIHPSAEYAHPDSMAVLATRLTALPYIAQVIYQRDLAKLMNSNVSRASIALLVVALALLIIAVVLITNTIRLQIYSKRFLINTMTLVGATPWAIKSPFVWRYLLIGTLSSLIAMAVVASVVYYVNVRMGILLFALTWQNIAFVAGVILLSGVLITLISSLVATSRYVRMSADTMYEI